MRNFCRTGGRDGLGHPYVRIKKSSVELRKSPHIHFSPEVEEQQAEMRRHSGDFGKRSGKRQTQREILTNVFFSSLLKFKSGFKVTSSEILSENFFSDGRSWRG